MRKLLLGFFLLLPLPVLGQAPDPVVHCVLFYSPTCPHCHELIRSQLIPLQNQYGSRFVVLALDTSQQWANDLYWEAMRKYEIPREQWAVPILLIEDEYWVGGNVIASRLPSRIEEGLASGGIDLPDFQPLLTLLGEQGLLDPRFPGRRIALLNPPPRDSELADSSGPQQGRAEAQEPGEDPAADSMAAADSVAVPGGAPDDSVKVDSAHGSPEETEEDPSTISGQEREAETAAVAPGPDSARTQPSEPDPAEPNVAPEPEETAEGGAPSDSSAEGRAAPAVEGATPPVDLDIGGISPAPARSVPSASSEAPSPGFGGLEETARELESMTALDRFNLDRVGNSFSVAVLLVMLLSLGFRGFPPLTSGSPWPSWLIPALVLIGTGVAAYLSFVEVAEVEAVCGPVGDCNTVNQSEYATLFGFLPVGVLGLLGYGLILMLWFLGSWGPKWVRPPAHLGIWGAALIGTLFSVYLTFLEPFVIGATCAWCLSSALIMTLLLWASSPLAARAWPGPSRARE